MKIILFIAAFILIFLSTFALQNTLQTAKQKKIMELLQKKDLGELEKELDSSSCRVILPAFNREFLRLNAYMIHNMQSKIDQQFNVLFDMKKNPAQDKEVTVRAFEYYVQNKNKKKSLEMLDKIKEMDDEGLVAHSQLFYDILIDKKSDYIDILTEQLENGSSVDKGINAYLLSLQYGYIGNKEKEKEYLALSKKSFKAN